MKYLVLILAALAQLGVVAWMIGDREWVLATGREVKFVTRPVDPSDPFRGRYVALDFQAARFETDADENLSGKSPVYALLSIDEEGYACVTGLNDKRPQDDTLYLVVDHCWRAFVSPVPVSEPGKETANAPEKKKTITYNLKFPFDRYYMNENAAPEAERRYREANRTRGTSDDAGMLRENYLSVRIKNGKSVARELYIKGQPIERLLNDQR